MTLYIPEEGRTEGPARICILGEPGVGKTRLAASFEDSYIIDLENGAASTGRPRYSILPSVNARNQLQSELKKIKTYEKDKDGALLHPKGFRIGTVVVDSIDAVQEFEKYYGILKGSRPKMKIQDWDTLYNVVFPVVLDWSALPVHVVVVAHVKQEDGESSVGVKGFSLQGAFKNRMPRWFDYIIHLVAGPEGKRYAITHPMINKGYKYTAKDRHGTLDSLKTSGVINIPAEDGFPSTDIAKAIINAHGYGEPK